MMKGLVLYVIQMFAYNATMIICIKKILKFDLSRSCFQIFNASVILVN